MDGQCFGVAVSLANGRKLFLAVGHAYHPRMDTNAATSKWDAWGHRIVNLLVILGMGASVHRFLLTGDKPDPASAGVACAVVAFAYFVLNFHMFSAFKAGLGGIEFAVKEAKEAAQLAVASVEQVRALALNISNVALGVLPGEFRGGIPLPERFKLKGEIDKALVALGASQLEIRDASKWFTEIFAEYHIRNVVTAFLKPHPYPTETNPVFGFTGLQDAMLDFVNLSTGFRMPPKEMRKRLEKMAAPITPDVDAALDDYQHFIDTGSLRRLDKWLPKEPGRVKEGGVQ